MTAIEEARAELRRAELAQGASAAHDLFRAYVDAGFTEPQAMELVKTLMAGSARK